MDLLCESDHKLCDLEEQDMGEILDNDVFQSPTSMSSDGYMDSDWLNSLFEDPVLNDKMITDAAQPPRIQSEHSYSINDNSVPSSPLGLGKLEDLDTEFFVNNQALDLTTKAVNSITENNGPLELMKDDNTGMETIDPTLTTITTTTTRTLTNKQPSIILATSSVSQASVQQPSYQLTQQTSQISSPVVTIKTEPRDFLSESMEQTVNMDSLILPPTPPGSSSSSDSEGSQSPMRSAPSSPIRQLPISRHHYSSSSSPTSHKPYSQPLFTNPIPQSGVLILSEEEKRTLISEGYPVPNKLPLTKQEEKNLKKIRRKIKNKISAQESRRKKKEYLEALEKRVEAYSQENNDLKKKMENLETNNRSLLGQLHKLQSLVGKVTRPGAASTQTGTVLMVLVLCFAIFLGSWSPSSLNIGYSHGHMPADGVSFFANPRLMNPSPRIGPSVQDAKVDVYATPNMKSRVLLSVMDDQEDSCHQPYGPHAPKGTREFSEPENKDNKKEDRKETGPTVTDIVADTTGSKRMEVITIVTGHDNSTETRVGMEQSIMHPDIAIKTGLMNTGKGRKVETETS